jgi:homoserine dehydrogenase
MTILGAHDVSIEQVIQDTTSKDPVAVVVLTHDAKEGDMRRALAEIDRLSVVKTPVRVIRIAGS